MAKKDKNTNEKVTRAPIVTIMGHVDHGKTSILDYIRSSNIQEREYGGITQHIGAYQVSHKKHPITFIDTPGHEAFSQMRSRGGKAADIVILVVAANAGVQPQTKEAIVHAKAADVSVVVAINKMDTAGADPKKIKQELAQENILVEDWGGDIVTVEVSAKTGKGIDELLDAIIAVGEILELKGNPNDELEAVIIESKLDKKRGVTVSCIVKNGTLSVGDEISASGYETKVKSLTNDKGQAIKQATLSEPVEILGFKEVPNVGDLIVEKGSDLAALAVVEDRVEIIGQNTKKTVGVIIKADTQGTLEAVKESLASLVTESVGADFSIKFMHSSTGDITDSDVLLASNTNSVIVGFNVKIPASVDDLAQNLNVRLKTFKTIYDLIDEVKELLEGTAFDEESKIKGRAQVLKKFKLPSGDIVAGSKVVAGRIRAGDSIEVYEKNPADITELDDPLYIGKVKKVKQGKEDTDFVGKGLECGILFKPQFDDLKTDLWIEVK